MGKDSNMRAGLPSSRAQQDAARRKANKQTGGSSSSSSYPTAGFHAVVFGAYIPDPASLNADESLEERLDATGGAMLSNHTPYKCWYTHAVALSDANEDGNTAAGGSANGAASSISTSARRMKRMVERFPRVTVAEFEVPENILTTIERFMSQLDHKVALGDPLSSAAVAAGHHYHTTNATDGAAAAPPTPTSTDYSDDLALSERHLDDLCGEMSVENSLLMLPEHDVDRIQIECERLVVALTQREINAAAKQIVVAEEAAAADTTTTTSNTSNTMAMPFATLVCPLIDLLATAPRSSTQRMTMLTGGGGGGGDDDADDDDDAANNTTGKSQEGADGLNQDTTEEAVKKEGEDKDEEDAESNDDYEGDIEDEGFLLPLLYGPSDLITATRIALPPTVIVRLYKSFSHDFYNETGDLSKVLQDVKLRRAWFERNHPMYGNTNGANNASSANKNSKNTSNSATALQPASANNTTMAINSNNNQRFLQAQLDECLDSLVFDLQSALLRNVPEGYCGSVGCGRYRDADEAVCLLQELYLKTFIEAETYKLPYSPRAGEGLKPQNQPTSSSAAASGATSASDAINEADVDDTESTSGVSIEGLAGNCRFIASPVSGSDAARRHVLLGRAELADPCLRDALHWIMPPSNLSAAATESNNDCVIM